MHQGSGRFTPEGTDYAAQYVRAAEAEHASTSISEQTIHQREQERIARSARRAGKPLDELTLNEEGRLAAYRGYSVERLQQLAKDPVTQRDARAELERRRMPQLSAVDRLQTLITA